MSDTGNLSCSQTAAVQGEATSPSLLDRARAGDGAAWRTLEVIYRPLVHWWCRKGGVRLLQDMEDVTQEVFVTLLRRLAEFERERLGSFRSWLRAVTRNKTLEHFKRRRRKPEAEGGSAALERIGNAPAPADDSTEDDPSERIILVRGTLESIREQVRPQTFEAAWRVLVEEQDPADVGSALGLSVASVYAAKSRILKRIRELLADLQL